MRCRCGSCLLAYPTTSGCLSICVLSVDGRGSMRLAFGVKAVARAASAAIVRLRLSVSPVVSRTALGVSDWPCGVRVSHKKVQMSPLNAAPNSNDNSMLMTLTLCQSSSQSNSVTAHCHTTPHHYCQRQMETASFTWVARSVGHLSCRLGRLAVRCAA